MTASLNRNRWITEQIAAASVPNPLSTEIAVFLDTDGALKTRNSSGTVTAVGSSILQTVYAKTTLGASASSITIPSLTPNFDHLIVVFRLRTDYAGATTDNVLVRFNADSTAANYYTQYLLMYGSTFVAGEVLGSGATGMVVPYVPSSTASAGVGAGAFTVYDYSSTTQRRFIHFDASVVAALSTGNIRKSSGVGIWTNTSSAVGSITLLPQNGANFLATSEVTVYGLD